MWFISLFDFVNVQRNVTLKILRVCIHYEKMCAMGKYTLLLAFYLPRMYTLKTVAQLENQNHSTKNGKETQLPINQGRVYFIQNVQNSVAFQNLGHLAPNLAKFQTQLLTPF